MTLYDQLKEAGIPLDNHESDLYAKRTPESLRIVRESGHSYSLFTSQVDGELWLDIPFAYEPFWANKMRQH